jgi:hypothetical protein
MEIDRNYNFNDPLKLTIIFREPIFKEGELDTTQLEEMGIQVAVSNKTREYDEYAGSISILWEDVLSIKTYPYKDEWKKFKGEKFYIAVEGQGPEYLVYGSTEQILAYWAMFRNRYPKFG